MDFRNKLEAKPMDKQIKKSLENFISTALFELTNLSRKLTLESYEPALKLILDAEAEGGRVHVTGIGKPGHVAAYIAALLSSTGTPAYELHATEAVHGSSGQVRPGDVVIAISNSGETAELKATVNTVKANGARLISVSGNENSWLAKAGDAFLYAGVNHEGDPLNRAPRTSVLAEILVLQGLSIILQCIKGLTPQQYIKWHPGGALGSLRDNEK